MILKNRISSKNFFPQNAPMETYNEVLTTQLKIFRRKAENVSLKAENDEKTIFF